MSIKKTVISLKFSVFLLVAAAFAGLGVFLDGRVLDAPSSDEVIVDSAETNAHSSQHHHQSDRQSGQMVSEITEQVQQAVERENLEDIEQSVTLKIRAERVKRRLGEVRQMFNDSGIIHSPQSESARQQSINSEIESLKQRLAELQ